jgi:hypothetical protein
MRMRTGVFTLLAAGATIAAVGLATRGSAGPEAPVAPAAVPPAETEPAPDLARPLRSFPLPAALREVSAVTAVDADTVACLDDEKGLLFFVDVHDGRLRAARSFGPDGDYEGLARVGGEFFVLRSDGQLARVADRDGALAIVETFEVRTAHHDLEGLCFDPGRGVLLLAPKDVLKPARQDADDARTATDRRAQAAERKAMRDHRELFAWDVRERRLLPEPVLRLSVAELRAQADARGDALPTKTNRRGTERAALRLMFSCIAVHPRTGDLYLLSAIDQVLIVLDASGELRRLHRLDPALLPKPEGLTFLPGGDLVLTSEGVDGPGRLAVYRQQ